MTPLLVLLFGFHPATAVGTDLLYASVTKSVGTAVHGKRQTVDWNIVGGLASRKHSSGDRHAQPDGLFRSQAAPAAPSFLNVLLGGALLVTSLAVFFRPWILRWAGDHIDAMEDRARDPLDGLPRRHARRAGVDHVGRRRRARHDGAADPLSKAAGRPHRRQRHRPRGAADPDRRHRPLADGIGRPYADGRAARRLDPRNHRRKPARDALVRLGASADPRRDPAAFVA